MHSIQPRLTDSACGLFTKNTERTKKLEETGDSIYLSKWITQELLFNII